jgi:predicted aspartyl protease
MHIRAITCYAILALALSGSTPAQGQAPSAPPSSNVSCSIDRTPPSEAEQALQSHRYSDAERIYTEALAANPNSAVALAGLVRVTLAQGKLPEALALAIKDNSAYPNSPLLLNALGEVRFRRGEVDEAAIAFNQSMRLNPCNAVTHYDVARFLNLSGMYASAQRRLEMAHNLSPMNVEITRRWRSTHAVPLTGEQRLAMLKTRLDNPSLTDDEKQGVEAAIKGVESREKGSCELVSPVTNVKLPIVSIANGATATPQDIYAAGLDVFINGKRKRLEIDTGASGLLIGRSVAKSAGLIPEVEIKASGVGDKGPVGAFVTHVDDIKIGSMEFKNCMVRVLEQNSVLQVDGLIGTDVFRDYLVTLDIPSREVRISPLPQRPDEQAAQPTSLKTSDDEDTPVSAADSAKDRYIAQEMKDWTPVFRFNHFLIIPTLIGNAPWKLFMMDTGAQFGMITPAAAREVTHVSNDSDMRVKGISGEVKNVMMADKVTIAFAGVRQITNGMQSFDASSLTQGVGAEISGIIGFPTLRELIISIDYRDNLVHVVYDPKKGFHAH